MAKIGRNDQCPCGSGKKHKHCCGSVASQTKQPIKSTKAELPPMGIPGQQHGIVVVNRFKDPNDPRNEGGPGGIPGKYKVTFTLWRPGFPLVPEYQFSFADGLQGDSHLAITKPAFFPPGNPDADHILITGSTDDGSFEFVGYPNQKGFLGKIVVKSIDAKNSNHAQETAYRALASALSNWSLHLDIPLCVYQVDVVELRTGNTQMIQKNPFLEAPFAVSPEGELKAEFRGYSSLYREAMNSNSPVYQFLCLFKIIEGVQNRRSRLGDEARKSKQRFSRPQETIPEKSDDYIPWLSTIFPVPRPWDPLALAEIFQETVVGRKFTHVINTELNPLRINVAHVLFGESGELTLSADESLHLRRVNKWLPLTKCIVRHMLRTKFPDDFLPYLTRWYVAQT